MGLLDCGRFNRDTVPAEIDIARAASICSDLSLDDVSELNEVCCTDQAMVGIVDQSGKESCFGFPK
jgi:hypothetical protein